jgi:hypothetical protein
VIKLHRIIPVSSPTSGPLKFTSLFENYKFECDSVNKGKGKFVHVLNEIQLH